MNKELKKAIKTAINDHHPKYKATKVWGIKVEEDGLERCTMWIEISVRKDPKPKKKKV